MDVGVISDTHLSQPRDARIASRMLQGLGNDFHDLYNILKPHFQGVEIVLHAGDIIDLSLIEVLQQFGDVYAVSGNMDPASVRASLPEKKILELKGFRIGMMHGWGAPDGLSAKIRKKFTGNKLDCIVFGHSHRPYDRVEEGILMFNPGSPTDRRFAPSRNIGILHLEDKIWGEHICLD